jgi:AcrR family transcriptional regulator
MTIRAPVRPDVDPRCDKSIDGMNDRKVKKAGKAARRTPNPKGQGTRLRGEILAAARRLLEEEGNEGAVGMRATAREAGVTAPAIYAHFADHEEMVEAVVAGAFEEFAAAVFSAMDGLPDPVSRLRAACRAYVVYGVEHPATYQVIFTRHRPSEMPAVATAAADVFQVLLDLLEESAAAGLRTGGDTFEDAVTLWLGLHGLASLPPSHPRFPWPDRDRLVDRLLEESVGVVPRTTPR